MIMYCSEGSLYTEAEGVEIQSGRTIARFERNMFSHPNVQFTPHTSVK